MEDLYQALSSKWRAGDTRSVLGIIEAVGPLTAARLAIRFSEEHMGRDIRHFREVLSERHFDKSLAKVGGLTVGA